MNRREVPKEGESVNNSGKTFDSAAATADENKQQNDDDWLTVILATVGQQCSDTWKWLREKTCSKSPQLFKQPQQQEEDEAPPPGPIQISSSMPDLQAETKPSYVQEIKEIVAKKVLRQTTLPIVSERHQIFQRQLSHRLDIQTEIKFSICSLERNHNSKKVGLIKPELYKKELVRQSSIQSNPEVNMQKNGYLHFSLKFDRELEGLVVKIFEARKLPIKDIIGSCDPYIKLHLLPDRKKKFQTKVHRKSQNPIFNETFIYSVTYEDLETRYLQFSVYDFDRFSRHDFIGHVVVSNLSEVAEHGQESEYSMPILCPPVDKVDLGELMVCLCFLPKAGRLTLTVIKGVNLKAMDITGKSDPYVKVYLVWQGKRIKKKKTSVRYNTLNPIFNEALVFDVPEETIAEVSLLVKVIDYDRIGLNELMGCFTIGPTDIGKGRDHWTEMLDNPRTPIAQWYPLTESVPGDIPSVNEGSTLLNCLISR
ncbi:synaptotagmin-10-like isoform X2 [Sitophilus oryzae]|uniref:Synaptotagmin-10-like isoform X2 n=1 Tax=Sitophilus oryzae TaxID=7048 RepID=A0A6J2X3D2_SITOR|nr:synaptotagmin-10-like isoform X2 [Sitophilus oryzae]